MPSSLLNRENKYADFQNEQGLTGHVDHQIRVHPRLSAYKFTGWGRFQQLARFFLYGGIFLASVIAAGCGQVITLAPTPTPEPTATIAVAVVAATPPPTPTPAPYTPAPTPTFTVTPTPVIYEVQSGDSLLVVANQYDVSVAALQEANGILDPRALRVGQQLIIPDRGEVEGEAAMTATPTPLPIDVQNIHFSQTSAGGLWVLGEVFNNSGVPLEQVRVGVTVQDDSLGELAENTLVALDLVDVNGRAPFAILLESAPESFDRYRIYPVSAVAAYVGSYYRDLEVINLAGESEQYASYTVSGTVYNFGPEEAVSVQVVLTAYDALDRVIAMRQIVPDHNVVPRGGETTFVAVLAPVGGPVARVEAVAQGRRLQEN